MIELYSIRDVSRILVVQESRLRYWMQTGFVGPTVRKGGRFYYTFCDLVCVKAAKDLMQTKLSSQKIHKTIDTLRKALPDDTTPQSKLRVCCDGETIVVLAEDAAPMIGNSIVMAFGIPTFGEHVSQVLAMPRVMPGEDGAPQPIEDQSTEANSGTTAYRFFVEACAAEDRGDSE